MHEAGKPGAALRRLSGSPLRPPLIHRPKPFLGTEPGQPFENHGPARGGLLKLNAVKQTLNVAGYRVRSHDERGVKRMDVLGRHRAFGMAHQSCDGYLGKAEVVGDAREAMT